MTEIKGILVFFTKGKKIIEQLDRGVGQAWDARRNPSLVSGDLSETRRGVWKRPSVGL